MQGPDRDLSSAERAAGFKQGITLAVAGFLPILAILSLAPAVPTFINHFKNVPGAAFWVPLMVTTPGLMVALLSPGAGWIVDRFGRRRPLLWATFLYGFSGSVAFLLDDLMTIFASRLLVGISETFIMVIASSLFADYFPEGKRRNWLTVQGLLGPILGGISLAAAGWLTSIYWNGVFLIYLSAFVIWFAMWLWFFEPTRQDHAESATPASPFPWKIVAAICGVTLFTSIIYYVFLVNGGLAFEAIGTASAARVGVIMGLASLGVPLGALCFNILSRKLPTEQILMILLVLLGIGTAGIGLSGNENTMAGFALVQQIGAGLTGTALIFWASLVLPLEHRGRGYGMLWSAFFMAQFISPAIVGGISAATGGILNSFVIMGIAGTIGGLVVALIARYLRSEVASPTLPGA